MGVFDVEYIPVTVNGMGRQFPILHVKITEDFGDAGANVKIRYPSFSLYGEVSLETKRRSFPEKKPRGYILNKTMRIWLSGLAEKEQRETEEKEAREYWEELERLKQEDSD